MCESFEESSGVRFLYQVDPCQIKPQVDYGVGRGLCLLVSGQWSQEHYTRTTSSVVTPLSSLLAKAPLQKRYQGCPQSEDRYSVFQLDVKFRVEKNFEAFASGDYR